MPARPFSPFSFSPPPDRTAAEFLREIAYSTHMDAIVTMREVFPELMRGRGRPVGGMVPLTTRALTSVWIP